VLTHDKRGVGKSGGCYEDNAGAGNLALLAADATAFSPMAGTTWRNRRSTTPSGHRLIG